MVTETLVEFLKNSVARVGLEAMTFRLLVSAALSPGGGVGSFKDRDQRSIFLGFEFRKSVFFGVLVTDAVFCWIIK